MKRLTASIRARWSRLEATGNIMYALPYVAPFGFLLGFGRALLAGEMPAAAVLYGIAGVVFVTLARAIGEMMRRIFGD